MSEDMILATHLTGISNCPHCGVANPTLQNLWTSDKEIPRGDGGETFKWAVFTCTTCSFLVVASAKLRSYKGGNSWMIQEVYPEPKQAHEDIPQIARAFLQQAFDTLHAPDAAGVMAGSAVDAMLKERGYIEGSLYSRIDQALNDHVLTQGMADWAHSVRLGSNRPRHADADRPHLTPEEAEQSVEFAEALGDFLFVLTAQITRGIEAGASMADEGENEVG